MRIVTTLLIFMLAAFSILAPGCNTNVATDSGRQFTESAEADISAVPAAPALGVMPPAPTALPVVAPLPKGDGNLSYEADGTDVLTPEQEQLLLDYMNLYYQSLAGLSAGDPSALFAEDAQNQALSRQSAWQVIIDVRSAQKPDLSLTAFSYELLCTGISFGDDGVISVTIRENAVQNFTAFPGVDSESHNVYHRFSMKETDAGWKLSSHMQMDSANMVALGRAMFRGWRGSRGPGDGIDMEAKLVEQRESVLSAHAAQLAERERQAAAYNPDKPPAQSWAHPYNREAAVAYAMQWVETRNTESWPSYDRNGGNCANFTSQCLLAGGIPMDYFGTSQWKWYGDAPNTAQAATGRSGAWSGVNEFYAYVTNNTGYGMVTEPDANYWSGEPGDLIQLGYEDNWRHVVIITEVIKDEAGNTVDYLINSNTADQRSYPVSAYLYPQQRLIKIYGWNEG